MRIGMAFVVAGLMASLLLVFVVPAFARPTHIFYAPFQPPFVTEPEGVHARCEDTNSPIRADSCTVIGVGRPEGLICDIPVTVVLPGGIPLPIDVFQCRTPEEQPSGAGASLEVTQESEQDAESGDIDQSFEVTSTGDNANQCAGVAGASNTGNAQTLLDLIQYASATDDFEFEEGGSDLALDGSATTMCDQQVNQAAAAG